MTHFDLDTIRASFTADMAQLLAVAREAAQRIVLPPLPLGSGTVADGRTPLAALSESAHAASGTAGLVGATELARVARTLENLAELVSEDRARLERQWSALADITELCARGVDVLGLGISAELGADRARTAEVVAPWIEAVANALAARAPLVEAGGDEVEYSLEVASPETLPPRVSAAHETVLPTSVRLEPGGVGDLQAVFRQEATEILDSIEHFVEVVARDPYDLAGVSRMERAFHTLKGAAAMTGAGKVTNLALDGQMLADAILNGETAADDEAIGRLEAVLAELRAEVSAPGLRESLVPPPEAPIEPELERAFRDELIETLERADGLVARAPDPAALSELEVLIHRLKGSAMIAGFSSVAAETARLEDLLLSGAEPSPVDIEAAFERIARDANVALRRSTQPPVATKATPPRAPLQAPAAPPAPRALRSIADGELWASFRGEARELLDSAAELLLAAERAGDVQPGARDLMRCFHTLKGAASAVGLMPMANLLHVVEDLLEELIAGATVRDPSALLRALLETRVVLERQLAAADAGQLVEPGSALIPTLRSMLDAAASSAAGSSRSHPAAGAGSSSTGSASVGSGTGTHSGTGSSVSRSAAVLPERGKGSREKTYVRVATARLDHLMNLAGELVVTRARLNDRAGTLQSLHLDLNASRQRLVERVEAFRIGNEFSLRSGARRELRVVSEAGTAAPMPGFGELEFDRYDEVNVLARGLGELGNDLRELGGSMVGQLSALREETDRVSALVTEMQTQITRARMVPVGQLYARLQLPIRDAAEQEGKLVRVEFSGDDVTVDKGVAETLFGPMLHLVRNAVVHGLEGRDRRLATGKDAVGVIRVRARQQTQSIVIEVEDDGAGLDLEALHRVGVERGLIRRETALDSKEVRDLVFADGVSTLKETTMVAGRGVGGGVVTRTIARLNGVIDVRTERGKGTTFGIQLPLTLAITRALYIRAAGQVFAIPVFFLDHIVAGVDATFVNTVGGRRLMHRDAMIPLRSLGLMMGAGEVEPPSAPIVVLRSGNAELGVSVDAVLGQDEIVVKSLGAIVGQHPLLGGYTLRGDGDVALIVDVNGLLQGHDRVVADTPVAARAPSTELRPRPLKPERSSVPAVAEVAAPVVVAPPVSSARRARRVLFVDDSLSVRKVAERLFLELEVEVTLATDGVHALEKAREQTFDAIFTDLEMPRMHGYELMRELAFVPNARGVPVIVVSSRAGAKHQAEAARLGAVEYVSKPFTKDVLATVLSRHVLRE